MLKLYNSLTRQIEQFKPINPPHVGMYTCGPTVYQFAHIGNFRSYFTADMLIRVLKYNGFEVKFVMNITDVGHMTQDQVGGGDTGEDKIEKTAKKEGKSVWEVARFYTDVFLKDYKSLNLTEPDVLCRATDHIKEQIALIEQLEHAGYTYRTSDGIYFDSSMFPDYRKMSSQDHEKDQARVEANEEKKNPRDFALWKFSAQKTFFNSSKTPPNIPLSGEERADSLSDKGGQGRVRQMESKSPWGVGFPGWHIECSAMSMKYLGETFDIHTGGVDHKEIHHPNEIAQAEAATHKPLAQYWIHTAFMHVAGQKMSKSLGNTYTLYDLVKEGYADPMALRYLYLQTHYRQEMNFTFPALDGAYAAVKKLRHEIALWDEPKFSRVHIDASDIEGCLEYEQRFLEALNDDLNTPQALAVIWELVKSDYPTASKAKSTFLMDEVLGLNLQKASREIKNEQGIVPEHIKELVKERDKFRKEKRYVLADQARAKIEKLGYVIEDSKKGTKIKKA